MDGLNDDQQLLQFEIQMATSEMQNAESTRSQAEKRLEDQRKDLRRNWAG
jgi:outer membrane murein-binding lipoprotein Lpp